MAGLIPPAEINIGRERQSSSLEPIQEYKKKKKKREKWEGEKIKPPLWGR